jgi:predicted permease
MGKLTPDLPVLIGVKLVVHPLIVYLLLSWVGGFSRLWINAAVLMAALPPAANVFLLAKQYKTYSEQASSAILLASVIAIATVTVVLILLLNNVLPLDPFR